MTRHDVTIEAVAAAFDSGLNLNQCASLFNCSSVTIRNRLESVGLYTRKKTPCSAQHGTRTMYVHHGCRCEACCKAEHEQYLKRPEAKMRKRVYSKHGNTLRSHAELSDAKRLYRQKRKRAIMEGKRKGEKQISWVDIADSFSMRCAICGCTCDPSDRWVNERGRHCFGRKYPTVDHIIPLKAGGRDELSNTQLACKHCNSKKGAKVVSA